MMQLDDYFDLTDKQYDQFHPKVVGHLKWAQTNIIPIAIQELQKLQGQKTPITQDQFKNLYSKSRQLWITMVERISEDSAALFLTLSPDQWAGLKEEIEEKHEDRYGMAYVPKSEYAEEYRELQETRLESLERIIGEVSEAQTAKIYDATYLKQAELLQNSELIIKTRNQFFAKAQNIKNPNELAQFFKAWAKNPGDEKYKDYRAKRMERFLTRWKIFESLLTAKQRSYRQEKIADYIKDLKAIQSITF